MIRFECDYAEGTHPAILEALIQTNDIQTPGYGEDDYCSEAATLIKKACGKENVDVHFLVGGTQANLAVIASILRPYEGVLAATTSHINTHETGAIEACGHKVLTLESNDGKIYARQVKEYCEAHNLDASHEHTVKPGMVFISNPSETGTIYSKAELIALHAVCMENNIPLYLDGARLGYALVCEDNDVTLEDITALCDVFYIGGTKIGAMFGEAVVITCERLKPNFRYVMKQKGAMLAKGRFLGIQFLTLFKDGLYFDIASHAIQQAQRMKEGFQAKGYEFLFASPTNQLFVILKNEEAEILAKKYAFTPWGKVDEDHQAVRFVASWASKEEDVTALVNDIPKREK